MSQKFQTSECVLLIVSFIVSLVFYTTYHYNKNEARTLAVCWRWHFKFNLKRNQQQQPPSLA